MMGRIMGMFYIRVRMSGFVILVRRCWLSEVLCYGYYDIGSGRG
jgi:hypothetical protein